MICDENYSELDLYCVLGLPITASTDQIRQKYIELSKIYHPDKAESDDRRQLYDKIFKSVSQAYKTLSHPEKRRDYLASLGGTYLDMKQDYLSGPLESHPNPNVTQSESDNNKFDPDQFNNNFLRSNYINNPLPNQLQTEAVAFDQLVLQRQQIDESIRPPSIDLNKMPLFLSQLYNQIDQLCYTESMSMDRIGFVSLRSSMLSTVGRIRDGIVRDPTLAMDLIILVNHLSPEIKQHLEVDWTVINDIKEQLQYDEPEWRQPCTDLAPSNFFQSNGHHPNDSGLLL